MDAIGQLKIEIADLERELARISAVHYQEKSQEVIEGGDITKKNESGFITIGSQNQIMNLQSRIQQKKAELARLEQYAREGAFGKIPNTPDSNY